MSFDSNLFEICEVKLGSKFLKKWKRSQAKLISDNLIIANDVTQYLAIANSGLANGVKRNEILNLMKSISDEVVLIQPSKKSYSLIKFPNQDQAKQMFKFLMGYCLKSEDNLASPVTTFYTHFLENFPEFHSSNNPEVLLSGLTIIDDFINEDEEVKLLIFLQSETEKILKNNLKNRLVWHYGYEFIYGTNDADLNKPISMPQTIIGLISKLKLSELINSTPNQITVNKYEPGQGIPSHIDNPEAFQEELLSLSLGSSIVMDFKHPSGAVVHQLVKPRSVMIMRGDARYVWTHGIVPRKVDLIPDENLNDELTSINRGIRISLTFRTVKENYIHKNIEMPSLQLLPANEQEATIIEQNHVHNIYNKIATHFSITREKPWPKVKLFIDNLQAGSLVLDVGCGSGRYLGVRNDLTVIGCDRSESLIEICNSNGHKVFTCDGLNLCVRKNVFDACICIAVVHHYSTKERRLRALQELVSSVSIKGKILIYVWALEQEMKRMKSKYLKEKDFSSTASSECVSANDDESQSKICVHKNRTKFKQQDMYVPWHKKDEVQDKKTFHRYYHVFKQGELEKLFDDIENADVIQSYYDDGNWCVIAQRNK